MAMTLRLSPEGEGHLDELIQVTHMSKTMVVETALAEMAERTSHRVRVQSAFARIAERDRELLELLAQ